MTRSALRALTVAGAAGYLLGTIGLMSAVTATAERKPVPERPAFTGPVAVLPDAALEQGSASLYSPIFTAPEGRKFR